MKVKAWESKQARTQAGQYGRPYHDRPVARSGWTKISDLPIRGLGVYMLPEESTGFLRNEIGRPAETTESLTADQKTLEFAKASNPNQTSLLESSGE